MRNSSVFINGSKITSINKITRHSGDVVSINARGLFISPGFIDSHVHGNPEFISANEIKSGTTSIVLAISCDSLEHIYKKIKAAKKIKGLNLLGIRLEGPYINPEKSGAQDKSYIKMPDARQLSEIINRCGASLKIMTIAPELKGAKPLIKILKKNRIIASVGHSNATFEEASEGIRYGIRHATHLFNAMSGLGGYCNGGAAFAALLEKKVFVEIILDLIHVPTALFKIACNIKGRDKIILITDSVRAETARDAKKIGGVYRFDDGRVAGSCLTMIDAVKNAVRTCNVCLTEAVNFAASNPARLLGIQYRKGSIAPGKDADLVMFDKDFNVKMTMINGKIVYEK